ncbi:hypothetical protein BYT27DRAFT_7202416 [Phlegmacium glaucopus]|nr:hypothetical protein BYT27DRAFT_7202416 [Phlegmacium glaucopus]
MRKFRVLEARRADYARLLRDLKCNLSFPNQPNPENSRTNLLGGANNSNHNSLKIALLMHNNWKWLC